MIVIDLDAYERYLKSMTPIQSFAWVGRCLLVPILLIFACCVVVSLFAKLQCAMLKRDAKKAVRGMGSLTDSMKAKYTAVIEKYKINGNNLTGLCPFHSDSNESLSVDLRTGKWHCFAEDIGGNFVSFWAKFYHIDTKDAYKQILQKYHVDDEPVKPVQAKESKLKPYSLEEYSFAKRLPIEYLRDACKVSTEKDRSGVTWLKTPYFREDGTEATYRKRYGGKSFRWKNGSAGKIGLYGEWKLPKIREAGYAIIVEGESDTQTLWFMGFPALGVPGASMFKPQHVGQLQDIRLYVHQEPDKGGETFLRKLCAGLQEGGFIGKIYRWSCQRFGVKDPSDLYLQRGKEEAARLISGAIDSAEEIDLDDDHIPEVIVGAPINLRQPDYWEYSEKGITHIDPKTYDPSIICRTPIILTRRLRSIETGEEKIEVAFKRDEKWHTAIYPRSTIFSSRSITTLSDLGCTITSENAKQVVRFLGALEAENIDVIPRADATSTFGWQPGKRFLPGKSDNLVLDIDPSQRGMAAAYCQNGTMEKWIEHMAPHRARDKFRFILAASFAAPLLRIVKQRIFFVYNWGGSKGGKTAALKAALSAWGDPERLMVNFNATQVGLERTAAFYCDLPLGIDERQLAGNNQGALEKIVYMIASGTGKIRGAKNGGLQMQNQWRTVAIATGEEPLSTDTTQTGVSTRVLEIYGGPFDNEQEAGLMHQYSASDCGWAGPAFIEKLIGVDERELCTAYESLVLHIREISDGKNGSHIAGIAAVALADALIDSWLFGGKQAANSAEQAGFLDTLGVSVQSWQRAKEMAEHILVEQVESNSTDVNENAVQFVVDWVLSNKMYFSASAAGTSYGMMGANDDVAYIFPSILNQALTKAGYSPRKTLKYMAERGLISTCDVNGSKRFSTTKRFGGKVCRFVEFSLYKLLDNESEDQEKDSSAHINNECSNNYQYSTDDYTLLPDGDLPF